MVAAVREALGRRPAAPARRERQLVAAAGAPQPAGARGARHRLRRAARARPSDRPPRRRCAAARRSRVCANEGLWSEADAYARIRARQADVYCFSPYWVGSIAGFHRLAWIAEYEGLQVCKHTHGELGLAAAAAHHVVLTLPNGVEGHQQTAHLMEARRPHRADADRERPALGADRRAGARRRGRRGRGRGGGCALPSRRPVPSVAGRISSRRRSGERHGGWTERSRSSSAAAPAWVAPAQPRWRPRARRSSSRTSRSTAPRRWPARSASGGDRRRCTSTSRRPSSCSTSSRTPSRASADSTCSTTARPTSTSSTRRTRA